MATELTGVRGPEFLRLRTLTALAATAAAACVVLAFTRPDGGWEWVPAISGLALFGVLAGRRVSRAPYPHVMPALVLAVVIPAYPIIAGFNRGRPLNTPDMAIDRAIALEPAWMLVYGSVFLFAFLPVFVVRGADLTRRVLWSYILVELVAYIGFVLYPTELPRPALVVDSFPAWTLQHIYDVDPPRNCFPSLHVAWATVAALSCYSVHRGVGMAALGWAALIGVSTLYTKQHYLVDVLGGIALAAAAYGLLIRGHARSTLSARDVQHAPRRALLAVGTYGTIVAVFAFVYMVR